MGEPKQQCVDIVVLGGCVADTIHRALATTATAESMLGTSTPCSSVTSFGGVGRNIAETCSRLSLRVALVSVVAADPLGSALVKHAQSVCGIDVRYLTVVPLTATATSPATAAYTAILDGKGELCAASAVMSIFESHLLPSTVLFSPTVEAAEKSDRLGPATRQQSAETWQPWLRELLPTAKWLVVDGNVPEITVTALLHLVRSREWEAIRLQRWSAANDGSSSSFSSSSPASPSPPPLLVAYDPISTTKCLRVLPSLAAIDLVKPNLLELTALSDACTTENNLTTKERTANRFTKLHSTAAELMKTLSRIPAATLQQLWDDFCVSLRASRESDGGGAAAIGTRSQGHCESWVQVLFQTVSCAMRTLLTRSTGTSSTILCTLGPLGVAVGRWQSISRGHHHEAKKMQNLRRSGDNESTKIMATCFLDDPENLSTTRAARARPVVQFFSADRIPAHRIRKVTGAGDAFLSGYLYAAVRGGRCTADYNTSDDEEEERLLCRRINVAKACAALALQASETVPLQLDRVLVASRL